MEIDIGYLIPEIVILVAAALAMIVGLSKRDAGRQIAQWVAAIGLAAAFASVFVFPVPAKEPAWWLTSTAAGLLGLKDGLHFSPQYITILTTVIGFLSVLAAWNMPFKDDPAVADSESRGEFFSMMLFSLAGVSMMGKVNDLAWLFIALELVSIPTYIMVATSRSQTIAQEAGVKYFFLGAMSAAVYLFGFSYLFGYAGSTRFVEIAALFSADLAAGNTPWIAIIGLLMVLVGVSYKIAAVPLHFYTPDVYQGAATPVTAFLAYAPKAAGIVSIIAVLAMTGWAFTREVDGQMVIANDASRAIIALLSVLAVLTMTIGNTLALLQRNVKRMLAYSSIAHSGYMLVGLTAGPGVGIADGVSATLFYLGAYAIMNLGAFAVLIYLQGKTDAAEDLDDLAGVAKSHPVAAFAMAICMFSLIGMPLTVGFLGKLYIVQAALANGHKWLAIITVVNAAIAAAYYLKIVAAMYLRDPWNPFVVRKAWAPRIAAGVCTVAVVAFFIVPGPLLVATGGWQLKLPEKAETKQTLQDQQATPAEGGAVRVSAR